MLAGFKEHLQHSCTSLVLAPFFALAAVPDGSWCFSPSSLLLLVVCFHIYEESATLLHVRIDSYMCILSQDS